MSDCSRLLNRKESEKYSAKWDRGINLIINTQKRFDRLAITYGSKLQMNPIFLIQNMGTKIIWNVNTKFIYLTSNEIQ